MRDDQAHPAEDVLEAYSAGALDEPGTARVEEHLLVCGRCRDRVGAHDRLRAAARAALLRPVDVTHATPAGPIRLLAEWTGSAWRATIAGAAMGEFPTAAGANQYLLETFAAMFPEHDCGPGCTIG